MTENFKLKYFDLIKKIFINYLIMNGNTNTLQWMMMGLHMHTM